MHQSKGIEWSSSNPFPWYWENRKKNPVYYDPDQVVAFTGTRGAWQVFRYHDVKEVLGNYKVFSVEYFERNEANPASFAISLTDPPQHSRLRSIVSTTFSPKSILELSSRIQQITDDLLNDIYKLN